MPLSPFFTVLSEKLRRAMRCSALPFVLILFLHRLLRVFRASLSFPRASFTLSSSTFYPTFYPQGQPTENTLP